MFAFKICQCALFINNSGSTAKSLNDVDNMDKKMQLKIKHLSNDFHAEFEINKINKDWIKQNMSIILDIDLKISQFYDRPYPLETKMLKL